MSGLVRAVKSDRDDLNARAFVDTIAREIDDVHLLILGDSTAAGTYSWSYMVAGDLAARYPTRTIKWSLFDDTTKTWPAQTTLATGSGALSINVWCGAVGTRTTKYSQRFLEEQVTGFDPDLVLICYGHNQPYSSGYERWMVRADFLLLTQALSARCPRAAITLIGQNPHTDSDETGELIIPAVQDVARMCGYGYVDFHTPFIEYGASWTTDLMTDTVHPNSTGYRLQANVILRALDRARTTPLRQQQPSSFLSIAPNLLVNGDFAEFTGGELTGWTNVSATLTEDTTHHESANGYSVRMVPVNGTDVTRIRQSVATDTVTQLRGKVVTFGARLRVASATDTITSGMLLVDDDVADARFCLPHSFTDELDGFVWAAISYRVDPAATSLTLSIVADAVANGDADVSIDRAFLVLGDLPSEVAPPVATGSSQLTIELTSDVDDWSPTGLLGSDLLSVFQTGAKPWKINGIEAQAVGTRITIFNNDAGNLTLAHEATSSAANNRFYCPNRVDCVIPGLGSRDIVMMYNPARWAVLGAVA